MSVDENNEKLAPMISYIKVSKGLYTFSLKLGIEFLIVKSNDWLASSERFNLYFQIL